MFKNAYSRRSMLRIAAVSAAGTALPLLAKTKNAVELPVAPQALSARVLSRDERYWSQVANYYDRTQGIVNLEHGYWGKMAHPVQEKYLTATRMVNAQNSFYARKGYATDHLTSVRGVARLLGVHEDEIVLTRNATEAIHNLIRQYRGLKSGDAVLYADVDYPSFKNSMTWLQKRHNVSAVQLTLPQRTNQAELLDLYINAFDANPRLKLMLLTHVSNQHGLIIPIKEIVAAARERGIDVICDNAQSWGLIDYTLPGLGVDWAGFNLHKWLGAPVGVGALYMRRGSLDKIAPYPGDIDPENTDASKRVHVATSNFASVLAIPAALAFHEAIGGKNKEFRLNYLRSLWTTEAETMKSIEVLGGTDEQSRTGMGSFRIKGKNSLEEATALQLKLENNFGIFTVLRKGLASGACVRITPQVFTTPDQISQLVDALHVLNHA